MSDSLPGEFDAALYRSLYSDLCHFEENDLRQHYEIHGRGEGRTATIAVPRDRFLQLVPRGVSILEIGPFNQPVVFGNNVKYFDLFDCNQLIERAREIGLEFDKVPHVDYVQPFGDLSIVGERFDAVISSHLLEHQPDLIRHLQQVERLFDGAGLYFLVVPDKRYCFDHFIPESSIADVLDAHSVGRTVHNMASAIEHWALTTHNDPQRHWEGDHGKRPNDISRVEQAVHQFKSLAGGYIDVHAWQFTPSSFRSILEGLNRLRQTSLYPIRVYDTPYGWNEFYAVLQKQVDG